MQIRDEDCEELRRICLQYEETDLTVDEAREVLSRLCFLLERFAGWIAKEKAAGRSFAIDTPRHDAKDDRAW